MTPVTIICALAIYQGVAMTVALAVATVFIVKYFTKKEK